MRNGKQKADIHVADKIEDLSLFDKTPEPAPVNDNDIDDERTDELNVVASIFPEFKISNRHHGSMDVEIAPENPVSVIFPSLTGTTPAVLEQQEISYLPPLKFKCQLPSGYPQDVAPKVELECSWLDQAVIDELYFLLHSQWEALHDLSVFAYIDTLQSSAETLFGVPLPLSVPHKSKLDILDYNSAASQRRFDDGHFDCGICLEPKKGISCYKIHQCGHVFCKACLKDYYTAMIQENDVKSVQCLDPTCGKDLPPDEVVDEKGEIHKIPRGPGAIAPAELGNILDEEMVKKYLKITRTQALEANKNTVYCPRKFCLAPAIRDNNDRLAICSECRLAFCADCGKTWHGYNFACRIAHRQKTEDEKLTDDFLAKESTPCPTCCTFIVKSGGCNHMFCPRCKTHFCLLCGSFLYADNPYHHFNQGSSPCYGKLWEGVDIENPDGELLAAPAPEVPAAPAVLEAPQRITFVRPREDPPAVPRDTAIHASNIPIVASVTTAPTVAPIASSSSKPEITPQNHMLPIASTSKDTFATPNTSTATESSPTSSSPSSSSSKPSTTTTTSATTTQYLSPKDESDFYVLQSTNEIFREGYLMLDSDLTIHEIAEFLREWVDRAHQPDRDRRFGLGEHWRRKLDWMRNVRDPRLARLGINLNAEGIAAGEQFGLEAGALGDDGRVRVPMIMGEDGELRKDEKALMARWLEIWDAGMGEITAKPVEGDDDDNNDVKKAGTST